MAELRLLTARQLRQVYRERVRSDFPPSERRPLASMERLRAAGVYDTWGMYEGEELLAYAFLWRSEAYGVALLDYLAVCREGRGRGTGTLALSLLQARYGGCSLLVEAEAQEEGGRRRKTPCGPGGCPSMSAPASGGWTTRPGFLECNTPCWCGRRRPQRSRSGSRMPTGACIGASSRTRCSGG